MCIRDRDIGYVGEGATLLVMDGAMHIARFALVAGDAHFGPCPLYTSDAADERSSVDIGGRRIIKKKRN